MNDTTLAPISAKRTGDGSVAPERASYDRGDFTWRQHQDGTWALHVEGRRGALLLVVPDAIYPRMWRIRHSDGRLSDKINLSRAKDAAGIMALGILNRPRAIALPLAEPGNYQGKDDQLG